MNTKRYVIALLVLFLTAVGVDSYAQETSSGYNENSIRPIHESDIMFKKRIWRRMDLREKQNRPFFAFNNEITKIIVEAVKQGVLYPYENDSLKTRMSKEQFLTNITLPEQGGGLSEEEKALGFSDDNDSWGDDGWGDTGSDATADANEDLGDDYFRPSEMAILELMEDMIFDKKRSRMYWDIQSVKIILPASLFPETGLIREVAVFKYKDLVELFKNMPDEAIWFNPQNSAAHRNLADAFELRLFTARITKVSNPRNDYIIDVYGGDPKKALMQSHIIEQDLIETEHNLWEY